MATFMCDCPRCGSLKANLDCYASLPVEKGPGEKITLEIYVVCRVCHRSSILLVVQKNVDRMVSNLLSQQNKVVDEKISLNDILLLQRVISNVDRNIPSPPEDLPEDVFRVLKEANTCLYLKCWNAASTMYRLALDLATKRLAGDATLPNDAKKSLHSRLEWLFTSEKLPQDLKGLADCVRQDGNDASHDGTLTQDDAEDLKDFATELLRRVYSEPARLERAKERRNARRAQ